MLGCRIIVRNLEFSVQIQELIGLVTPLSVIYFLPAKYGLICAGDGAEYDHVHDQLDDAGRL